MIAYAVRNATVLRYLLDNGATIVFEREGASNDDIQAAARTGPLESLKMLLADPQSIAAGRQLTVEDLSYAAYSTEDKPETIRFILQSPCFGIEDLDTGAAGEDLSPTQRDAIIDSIGRATHYGSITAVKLLLRQLTSTNPDGTFAPFSI